MSGFILKAILIAIISILTSCVTGGTRTASDYTAAFKTEECAIFNPAYLEDGQSTEAIPFYIADVGPYNYTTVMDYPGIGPKFYYFRLKIFDKVFLKHDCPANVKAMVTKAEEAAL
jgi:hypothetical protein